jgi:1,6-anhydro-N-acetylmuramate kinase
MHGCVAARHRPVSLPSAADVQATLAELTAVPNARADACRDFGCSDAIFLCGGGAFNTPLLRRRIARAVTGPRRVDDDRRAGRAATRPSRPWRSRGSHDCNA